MSNNHYTSIKTNGFKRFGDFELSNIGQFNLIVGNNNIGKTSLLEMLLINRDAKTSMINFRGITDWRVNISTIRNPTMAPKVNLAEYIFDLNRKGKDIQFQVKYLNGDFNVEITRKFLSELNKTELEALKSDNVFQLNQNILNNSNTIYIFKYDNNEISTVVSNEAISNIDIPFLPSKGFYDDDLTFFYSKFIAENKNNKKKLIDYLKLFYIKISDIGLSTSFIEGTNIIGVFLDDIESQVPYFVLGDGFNKYLRIILEIFNRKNEFLLIDEIDNGIYYKNFRNYWMSILKMAKENNVQLFMTTHSYECIESYIAALNDLDLNYFNDSRMITLQEVNKSVKAYVMEYNEFSDSFKSGNELRSL